MTLAAPRTAGPNRSMAPKKDKPLKRLMLESLPAEWHLPFGRAYTQLTLNTCQLAKLPAMLDMEGILKPGPVSTMQEQSYEQLPDLDIDDVDQAHATGDGDDEEDDAPQEDAASARKQGMRCVSLRLASNHFQHLERRVFEAKGFRVELGLVEQGWSGDWSEEYAPIADPAHPEISFRELPICVSLRWGDDDEYELDELDEEEDEDGVIFSFQSDRTDA